MLKYAFRVEMNIDEYAWECCSLSHVLFSRTKQLPHGEPLSVPDLIEAAHIAEPSAGL